jgi:N,N'-diacetyllegionaminate synthase
LKKNKVYIIAEIGVNHDGNIAKAKKLIRESKKSGADCVKFQLYKTSELITKNTPMANYQKINLRKSLKVGKMLMKYELSIENIQKLKSYCEKIKIDFLCTPFDMTSIKNLKKIGLNRLKISSSDNVNTQLLEYAAKNFKDIIISTGMTELGDIKYAFNVIKKYFLNLNNLTILHCNTDYPTPFSDVNMNCLISLKKIFKTKVGYSDHTLGIYAPIIAVTLGARCIEKHITLDKNAIGPDHKSSILPSEFKEMVTAVRITQSALGSEIKKITNSEYKNIIPSKKSIVAKEFIKKGDIFSLKNITVKRPGDGLSPKLWHKVIGKRAKKNFLNDDFIIL